MSISQGSFYSLLGSPRLPKLLPLVLSLSILLHLTTPTFAETSASSPLRNRIVLSVGIPQTISIGYEHAVASPLQLQVNVGSIILASGLNGRVLVVPDQWRLQPYAFVGGGLLYVWTQESDNADGWTGFTWLGAGLRLKISRFLLFGELGEISNLNESNGYDPHYMSGAVGILYEF